MGFQTTSPIACAHAVPFSVTCPYCVLETWQTAPRAPEPRRLRAEVQRDAQLERRAEARESSIAWEAGL